MSQYPGGQPPPQDPYYGQQPPADPYAAPPPQAQPSDPYHGSGQPDPYAPPQDPYYGQQPPDAYAQQQAAWAAQQPPPPPQQTGGDSRRSRGGSGAAVVGIVLVLIGIWILFGDQFDIDLDWSEVWPIGAVILGALMVVASVIPRGGDQDR